MKKLYLSVCLAVLCMLQSFAQVPVLNSYPSAPAVIYLDFNGHYVSGTSWNWNGPFTCGPANLTATQMKEIFERVAEDYRPFNLNITTDSAKYWAAPLRKRTRVVLTVTNEWYGSGAGGVASTGSFSRGDNTPAFVFTKLLGYNTKNVAEAASHEAGHTLGLRHQAIYNDSCLRVTDYNTGIGSGEASWAPIMGAGYNRNVTTWHMGTSSRSCTSIQSDLQVITDPLYGVPFRKDDHANIPLSASPAVITGDTLVAEGIIEQPSDFDYFSLSVKETSMLHLEAKPYSIGANNTGANLNVKVALVDADQNEIANFSSASRLSETIDTVLKAGTYFVKVDGDGGQYFSDYGSLGNYSLKGSLTTASILPLRRLQLQGSTNGNEHLLRWVIDADEKVVGQVVEASGDGTHFSAVGEPAPESRQWHQGATDAASVQYRLRVLFANGREHLSNAIVLQSPSRPNQRPRLVSTLVSGSSILTMSPVPYRYQVCDLSGKVVMRGSASSGSQALQGGTLGAGMYLVKFSWEGGENVEKMLKK